MSSLIAADRKTDYLPPWSSGWTTTIWQD